MKNENNRIPTKVSDTVSQPLEDEKRLIERTRLAQNIGKLLAHYWWQQQTPSGDTEITNSKADY